MRMLIRLGVLGLAAYGAKTLYDKYGAAAQQVAGRRDELTGQVRRVAETARGQATEVVGHATQAARGVAGHAKRSAADVAEEGREAASTIAEEVREAAATAEPGTAGTATGEGPDLDLTAPATPASERTTGAAGATTAGAGRARMG
jgi:hypothetical protein